MLLACCLLLLSCQAQRRHNQLRKLAAFHVTTSATESNLTTQADSRKITPMSYLLRIANATAIVEGLIVQHQGKRKRRISSRGTNKEGVGLPAGRRKKIFRGFHHFLTRFSLQGHRGFHVGDYCALVHLPNIWHQHGKLISSQRPKALHQIFLASAQDALISFKSFVVTACWRGAPSASLFCFPFPERGRPFFPDAAVAQQQ